eukprot:gnl/Hemi2/6406_TR2192_c0_g21_i1.p1 gnl/Hemi2/6406_TR2192_c0_g21~~gnl/Hemi2/6406_TR2192_c0_g21_i1.p1  ORF type:complete len:759 (-),score=210.88 gnl/Hemi2/6406_TR2192_c0_g21_i1:78-2324(-)
MSDEAPAVALGSDSELPDHAAVPEAFRVLVRTAQEYADSMYVEREKALSLVRALHDYWLNDYPTDRTDVLRVCLRKFGLQQDEDPNFQRLHILYAYHRGVLQVVWEVCDKCALVPRRKRKRPEPLGGNRRTRRKNTLDSGLEDELPAVAGGGGAEEDPDELEDRAASVRGQNAQEECGEILAQVIEAIYYCYELLTSHARLQHVLLPSASHAAPINFVDLFRFTNFNSVDLNAFNHLLLFLTRELFHLGYRRQGNMCCEEITVANPHDPNQPFHTHYWQPVVKLSAFVSRACNKETHAYQWALSTRSPDARKKAIQHLTTEYESEFPDVNVFRRLFAFRNGLFLLGDLVPDAVPEAARPFHKYGRFFFYGSDEHLLGRDICACRFFDANFPEHLALQMNSGTLTSADIFKLDTSTFDSIFVAQGFVAETLFQTYALFGRLLYEVGERDNYQVAPFPLGIAGSGKSTCLEVISSMFAPERVSVISSNCQTTFALSTSIDSELIVFDEMKTNCQLSVADLQSAISGGPIAVNIKFKDTNTILHWKVPMIFCGNEPPGFLDSLGALARRFVILGFNVFIVDDKVNGELKAGCLEELPLILFKVHACYLLLLENHGKSGFWKFACTQFKEWRHKYERMSCPLLGFLDDPAFTLDPQGFIHWDRLQELFQAHCKRSGFSHSNKPLNMASQVQRVLELAGLRRVTDTLPVHPEATFSIKGDFVVGIYENAARLSLADPRPPAQAPKPRGATRAT